MVSSGGKRRVAIEDDDDYNNEKQGVTMLTPGSSTKRARLDHANDTSRSTRKPCDSPSRQSSESSGPVSEDGGENEEKDRESAAPAFQSTFDTAKSNKRKAADQRDEVEVEEDEDGHYTGSAAEDNDSNANTEEEATDQHGADALRKKQEEEGIIAESGVVDTIVLKNFMCHRFLEVKLDPQINFIIGHNGSGKSVILTALVFAFGTKASVTNRAKTLSDFVQEGASYCEVIVSLRNKGPEAYKYDTYGHTIFITRKVNAEGGGSYKIADYRKNTVTTRRDELAAICDHFDIQMDNPVNILNQDMAKTFLHSQKPTDKYKLFMVGTQLTQLSEAYEKLNEQIQTINYILAVKEGRLEELKEVETQASAAWKEIKATKNVETKIKNLKNELAWTQVVDIEKEMYGANKVQMTQEAKVAKYEESVRELKQKLEAATAAINAAEATRRAMDIGGDEDEMANLKRKIDDATARMGAISTEHQQMKSDLDRLEGQVNKCDADMEAAMALTDADTREKRAGAQRTLDEVNAQVQALSIEASTAKDRATQLRRDAEDKKRQIEGVRNDQEAAQQTLMQSEALIRGIESRRLNAMNAFGPRALAVLTAINRERSWREKPIGPIGRYVKLELEGPTFGGMCESLFGDMLNGFIVTNEADRERLKTLIYHIRGARHNVYTVQLDKTNWEWQYLQDVPGPPFKTLHDILTIEHKYVLKLLIDKVQIHSSILVEKRAEGDAIMRNKPPKVSTCLSADRYRLGGLDKGARMLALGEYGGAPRLTKDVEGDYSAAQKQRQEAEIRLREINEHLRTIDREVTELYVQSRQSQDMSSRATRQIQPLKNRAEDLAEEAKERQPPNIQAIQSAKDEALDGINTTMAQMAAAEEQLRELRLPVHGYKRALMDLQNLQEQRRMIQQNQDDEIERLVARGLDVEAGLRQRTASREKAQEDLDEATRTVAAFAVRLDEAMTQASGICPREDVTLDGSSRAKLERIIGSLEKSLRDKHQSLGGNAEDIYRRYLKAKQDHKDARTLIEDLKTAVELLTEAYHKRVDKWGEFRETRSARARALFLNYLSKRRYSGELKFKHDEQMLELRINTDDDGSGSQSSQKTKDVSSLSGGEKSFSTICLLLSIWEVANCPIRGLDEYDVFMDAVNRKIATNLLIKVGQSSNAKQMILITPQALQGYAHLPGVKLIQIADPERNQGILAAES